MPPPSTVSASVLRAAFFATVVALSACATTAPPPRPAPAPEAEPPPAPVPPPPAPEPAPPPPPEPPPPPPEAPEGTIEARSLYPQLDLADWTLANGLRVVFKRLDGDGFAVRSAAPTEPRDTEADGLPTLEDAISYARDVVRVGVSTVVLVGPADVEAVEGWVATRLARVSGVPSDAGAPLGSGTLLTWDDFPAALVLRAVLDRRDAGQAALTISPSSRTLQLFLAVSSVDGVREALRPPSDAEVRAARSAIGIDASLWAETLALLFAEPGDYRPARRPEAASAALARIGAVPPSAVDALLERLRTPTR